MADMYTTTETGMSIGDLFSSVVDAASKAYIAKVEGQAKTSIANTAANSPQANLIAMGVIGVLIIVVFFIVKKGLK